MTMRAAILLVTALASPAGQGWCADRAAERAALEARLDVLLAAHGATVRDPSAARTLAECGDRGATAARSRIDGDGPDRAAACRVIAEAAATMDAGVAARCLGEPLVDGAPLARLVGRVNAEGLAAEVARRVAERVDGAPGSDEAQRPFAAGRIGLLDDPSVAHALLDLLQPQPDALPQVFVSLWTADPGRGLALIEAASRDGDPRVGAMLGSLALLPVAVRDEDAARLVAILEPRFPEGWLVPGPSLHGTEARIDSLSPVVRLLHGLGEPALPALRRLAASPRAGVRRNAVLLLGEMPEAAGSPALRRALEDADASVRDVAIGALQRSEACDAADAVRPLLVDDDAVVRRRAALFFAACPGTAAREELDEAASTVVPATLAFYERVQRVPDVPAAMDAIERRELLDVPRAVPLPVRRPPRESTSIAPDARPTCCETAEGVVAALLDGPRDRRARALALDVRGLPPAADAALLRDALAFIARGEDAAIAEAAVAALASLQSP